MALTKYVFHGSLKKKAFGKQSHQLAFITGRQVFSHFKANYPTFLDDLKKVSNLKVIAIKGTDVQGLDVHELAGPLNHWDEIHFVPAIKAAGTGIGEAVVAAIWGGGSYAAASAAIGATLATVAVVAINIAVGLAVGAVINALTPQPSTPQDGGQNNPSRMVQGSQLYTTAGHRVPKIYGRGRVNATIVSQGLFPKQIPLF